MSFRLCALVLGIHLGGCAGLWQTMERPRINIANIAPREIRLFEQVFDLELRIQNPNDSPLSITGVEFELQLNDKRFATGVSHETATVDRLSSAVIHVEAVTSLWGILRQVAEIQNTHAPQVRYRIKGRIFSDAPGRRLPFDDIGEIRIPLESTR